MSRLGIGLLSLALAASALGACESRTHRTKPVEVPISEFKPGKPGPNDPRGIPLAEGAETDGGAEAGSETTTVATKLDEKEGFLGATFGSSHKAIHGIKSLDKKGADPARYRGSSSYAGVGLTVEYTFAGGKLASMTYTVKKNGDCKKMREALEKELGEPQKVTTGPDTALWRGDKVGLKFVGGVTCGGSVVSKELAEKDFAALE